MADVKLSDDDKAPKKAVAVKEEVALANTVPSYTGPTVPDLPLAVKVKDALDKDDTTRSNLLNRLDKALEVAPADVAAALEARLAHLVYDAESRVPGLV